MRLLTLLTQVLAAISLTFVFTASAHADDVTTLNGVGPERDFPRVWRSYSSMDKRYSRVGRPRDIQAVRDIQIGSSKQQLVNAIGQPISAYGDGSWNFNVSLPLPQRNRLICQYRVYFDEDDRVEGTLWRRPQCAEIVLGQSG